MDQQGWCETVTLEQGFCAVHSNTFNTRVRLINHKIHVLLNSEHQPQQNQLSCFQNAQFSSFSFLNKPFPSAFWLPVYQANFEEWTLGLPPRQSPHPFPTVKGLCGWDEPWLMLAKSIMLFPSLSPVRQSTAHHSPGNKLVQFGPMSC